MKKQLIPILVLWLSCSGFAAKVVAVHDGDTLTVERQKGGDVEKIRLARVDAPELKQKGGKDAQSFVSDLCLGQVVEVSVRETDKYGRMVSNITLPDGRNLNEWIVLEGLAWWYRAYAKTDRTLELFEDHAKRHQIGLWEDDDPTPPWTWRREQKAVKKKGFGRFFRFMGGR